MSKTKMNHTMIVFVSQNNNEQLYPLVKNRPAVLLQVAGKTIIEWFYEIGKKSGINEILLLANKEDRHLLYQALDDYQETSASINEIGPFAIIDYNPKKGITEEIMDDLLRDRVTKDSVWLDGNIIFSPDFFKEFLKKAEGTGKYALVEQDNDQCLGIGLFAKNYLESCALGANRVNDIFEEVSTKTQSAILTMKYEKKNMEFWQINYLWNLLDANQVLINYIDEKKSGTIEDGTTIIGKVSIGKGSRIRAGSYLEGPLAIGKNCDIGPNCYLRKGVSLSDSVRIGNACELKNTIVFDGTHIAHLSYVGDSIIGMHCNFGAGTITGNLRLDDKTVRTKMIKDKTESEVVSTGRRKIGVIMGDNVKTAINTFFMPGVIVGNNSAIGTGVIVNRNIGSNVFVCIDQEQISREWKIEQKKKKG
ncbi:MAG: hypothetical protein HZR80_06790 [Candidatus Heimdallarchaeota archaeon]